jgi:hypothetical protein
MIYPLLLSSRPFFFFYIRVIRFNNIRYLRLLILYFNIFLHRIPKLALTLVLTIIATKLYAKETTEDFISKYNKYNNVCRGMGYERRSCKEREQGKDLIIRLFNNNTLFLLAFVFVCKLLKETNLRKHISLHLCLEFARFSLWVRSIFFKFWNKMHICRVAFFFIRPVNQLLNFLMYRSDCFSCTYIFRP